MEPNRTADPGETDAVAHDATVVPAPGGYRLVTPTDWFRIPLTDEGRRDRSVRALVDRTCPDRDGDALRRRELTEFIGDLARRGAEQDGVELYLSTQTVLDVPVPASLLISLEIDDRPRPLPMPHDLLAAGLREKYSGADVSIVGLPAGTAVRCRREDRSGRIQEVGADPARPGTLLEYFVQVPDTGVHLVLTFNTPVAELADALVEMFDAIARSLRWNRGT
ncbi:hypothetical protein FNQ90_03055 [Streptomyces alkaliphilus]|uniref:Uncharacterized protein n=1 Tax=Streptomyces alkaliphilus TaxID=1472722 RepID=A0A7W3Y010_9ACTN|nr:hypothetical protein [Streptomyces alkaliphilus]MBB0243114.1 hypothetical protein [Streptomyces alkaliphilus]